MFEGDDDVLIRVIERLRKPVRIDPALDSRIMSRLTARDAGCRPWAAAWEWLRHPLEVSITPLSGILAAALVAGVAVWLGVRRAPLRTDQPEIARSVQFVVVVPHAKSVALVGDFNDWDADATPMLPASGAIWSATVPLTPGRHRYAFLVDGSRWLADPSAPRAHDDFGSPSSVMTVGG